MATYKYYIDGIERSPVNTASLSIEEDLVTDAGSYFLRANLSGGLRFVGSDYKYFESISNLCKVFSLEIKKQFKQPRGFETIFKGRFTLLNMEFNSTECSVDVDVEPLDMYTCLMRALDKEFNFAEVTDSALVTEIETGRGEIQIAVGAGTIAAPPTTVYSADPTAPTTPSGYGNEVIEELIDQKTLIDYGGFIGDVDVNYVFYCREIITTPCLNGTAQPPAGGGWTLLSANCTATGGTSKWWRPYDYTNLFKFNTGFPGAVYPWSVARESPPPYATPVPPEFEFIGTQVNPSSVDYDVFFEKEKLEEITELIKTLFVKGGRDFITATERMLQSFCGTNANIISPFFTATNNPVTGTPNICKGLQLWTKSDVANAQVKQADADNNIQVTSANITVRDFFSDLNTYFNVEWYKEPTNPNALRIAHVTESRPSVVGLDLTVLDGGKWLEYNDSYRYTIETVPLQEKWKLATASLMDFVGLPIDYNDCGENVKIYNSSLIDTELAVLLGKASQRDMDGFILVQPDSLKQDSALAGVGILSGSYYPNIPLSISNLQDKFWRDDRPLPTGTMNNTFTVFDSTQKILEQEVTVPMCDPNSFDRRKLVRTQYGEAQINKLSYNLKDETLTLTLRFNK